MRHRINPFHEVYVTERIAPKQYVELFSPVLVNELLSQSLFKPGNIVILGTPGSGKSMLLSLLTPETRIAYSEANVEFPIPKADAKFVGAGINLMRSRAVDFSQRTFSIDKTENLTIAPLFFADFINYWVVWDLLKSIKALTASDPVSSDIGLTQDSRLLDEYAINLSKNPCWFDGHNNVQGLDDFICKLRERLTQYRSFLNFNINQLSDEIQKSKTSIGEPISIAATLLSDLGVVTSDVAVYIRIDEFERLREMSAISKELGVGFEEVIHKALGIRDSGASYRVGSRKHVWSTQRKIFGTDSYLEESRNYKKVDLDKILMREENPRTWVFPNFAKDVFNRRIKNADYQTDNTKSSLHDIFGEKGNQKERALVYVKNPTIKLTKPDKMWPKRWVDFLSALVKENPIGAVLAAAYARQRDKGEIVNQTEWSRPFLWDEKKWWRKERIELALMQIASRNNEALRWYGEKDIIELSGGNILAFISICQHIWDGWLRDEGDTPFEDNTPPKIDREIQTSGIRLASANWMSKTEDVPGGARRRVFIEYLGGLFREKLIGDLAMSYPGHNGFSLSKDDLDAHLDLKDFLQEGTDYGHLYSTTHASRVQGETERRKWYLHQIFSPYLKIHHKHGKEPWYVSSDKVIAWMKGSLELRRSSVKYKKHPSHQEAQRDIFHDY